ncbi:MAG: zincin-like metallopeptidase domain-containing protein [Methylorubrum rhodinum]|uniref:ArdC family protein n=1 Tax=Methylorubrum rhodinum TaxID=29428 RepID=UPI003BAFCDF8
MPTEPYAHLTATILAQLATADPASWSPPWHGADPLPVNALTGRRYRGLNTLVLWAAAQAQDYTDPRWATYRQWAALGAQVRKAERGTAIVFYKDLPADAEGDAAPGQPGPRFVARASHVFNAAQVDGAPDRTGSAAGPMGDGLDPADEQVLSTFLATTGARIIPGGKHACYSTASDTIRLPARSAFPTFSGYAGTIIHELVHWSGAAHRLARDLTGRFGSRAYAAEELVAEIGAAFVLADIGLVRTPHPDHAAYCAAWATLLRDDPRALTTAARLAAQAAGYLGAYMPPAASDTADGGTCPGPAEPDEAGRGASDPGGAEPGIAA